MEYEEKQSTGSDHGRAYDGYITSIYGVCRCGSPGSSGWQTES